MILGEAAAIAIAKAYEAHCKFWTVVIEGQPDTVKKELWNMFLSDLKDWRAFWQGVFGVEPPKK